MKTIHTYGRLTDMTSFISRMIHDVSKQVELVDVVILEQRSITSKLIDIRNKLYSIGENPDELAIGYLDNDNRVNMIPFSVFMDFCKGENVKNAKDRIIALNIKNNNHLLNFCLIIGGVYTESDDRFERIEQGNGRRIADKFGSSYAIEI